MTLKELGLTIFIAGIGVKTGAAFLHADPSIYGAVIITSVLVLAASIAATFLVSYRLLGFNLIASLACIAGGLTSTPSLALLTDRTKSEYPLVYFSSLYPLALLAIIVSSQALSLVLMALAR